MPNSFHLEKYVEERVAKGIFRPFHEADFDDEGLMLHTCSDGDLFSRVFDRLRHLGHTDRIHPLAWGGGALEDSLNEHALCLLLRNFKFGIEKKGFRRLFMLSHGPQCLMAQEHCMSAYEVKLRTLAVLRALKECRESCAAHLLHYRDVRVVPFFAADFSGKLELYAIEKTHPTIETILRAPEPPTLLVHI